MLNFSIEYTHIYKTHFGPPHDYFLDTQLVACNLLDR